MPLSPEQIAAIPSELKVLRQWVWFEIVAGRKIPRTVHGGFGMASPTNPGTWSTFEEVQDLPNPAFCFTPDDPYVFVDLDEVKPRKGEDAEDFENRRKILLRSYDEICGKLPSYMETSTSGQGLHIIGRGLIGPGARSNGVEVYDRDRFCIFTGNIAGDITEIRDFDAGELASLISQIRRAQGPSPAGRAGEPLKAGEPLPVAESREQTEEDEEVVARVRKNPRGALFLEGRLSELGDHDDRSRYDHEFIAILSEHTGNREQVTRIFQNSPLLRPKTTARYVSRTFDKIRPALEAAREHTAGLLESLLKPPAPKPAGETTAAVVPFHLNGGSGSNGNHAGAQASTAPSAPKTRSVITKPQAGGLLPTNYGPDDPGVALMSSLPPGMVRDLAYAFYWHSIYPLAEVGILSGLAAFALAAQRGFQGFGNKALNFYAVLLAVTSAGKSPLTDGIPELLALAGRHYVRDHWTGELRSEAAFAKKVVESNRLVMLKTECASWFSTMTDEGAAGWERSAADALTTLYSQGHSYYSLPRNAQADMKDEATVWRVTLSVLGETQPGPFWAGIKSQGMNKGFVARFLILEVDPASVQRRMNTVVPFPVDLVTRYQDLLRAMEMRDKDGEGGTFVSVPLDPEAKKLFMDYCEDCRNTLLDDQDSLINSIWGKLGENALRIATLLAVSREWDAENPQVNRAEMLWAIRFVQHCAKNTMAHITENGTGDTTVAARRKVVLDHFRRIVAMPAEERRTKYKGYFHRRVIAETPQLVPVNLLRFLSERNKIFAAGQRDSRDFDTILASLVKDGDIWKLMDTTAMEESFKVPNPCAVAHPPAMLEED